MTSSRIGMLVQGTSRRLSGLRAVAIHRCWRHSPGGLVLNILQKLLWSLSIPAFASLSASAIWVFLLHDIVT